MMLLIECFIDHHQDQTEHPGALPDPRWNLSRPGWRGGPISYRPVPRLAVV
jgi:hypothetical protein